MSACTIIPSPFSKFWNVYKQNTVPMPALLSHAAVDMFSQCLCGKQKCWKTTSQENTEDCSPAWGCSTRNSQLFVREVSWTHTNSLGVCSGPLCFRNQMRIHCGLVFFYSYCPSSKVILLSAHHWGKFVEICQTIVAEYYFSYGLFYSGGVHPSLG